MSVNFTALRLLLLPTKNYYYIYTAHREDESIPNSGKKFFKNKK